MSGTHFSSRRLPAIALLAIALAAGCTFQADLPADLTIHCDATTPCPDHYTCRPVLGRCVSDSELQQAPGGVQNPSLLPATGSPQTTFNLTFSVTRSLASAPVAYATRFSVQSGGGQVDAFPFTCDPCTASLVCVCSYTPDPLHLPDEGPLQAFVEIVDAAGNAPPPVTVGVFDFDSTPPAILPPVRLEILPGPGVTTPVSAVGPEGSAQVCFTVSETIASNPLVWAAPTATAAPEIPFAFQSVAGDGYCFQFQRSPGDGLPDGLRGVYASAQDLAGNTAQLSLVDPDGGLMLLATSPQPPDLEGDGGLHYLRAPWGRLPDYPAVPRFTLSATGAAIPQDGWLLASADSAGVVELGRAAVSAGALPEMALLPQDHPEVWVDLVDAAGNNLPQGRVRVRQVDWVANLGLKQLGDSASNPHSCFARPAAGRVLLEGDDPLTEITSAAADGGAQVVAAQPTWRERWQGQPSVDPGGFAYDSARGRLVAYSTDSFEVEEFDGVDWTSPLQGTTGPTDRYNSMMAYDRLRGRTVLFGGDDSFFESQYCDTWEWDGSSWEVRSNCVGPSASATAPPARSFSCFAYDPVRAQTVLTAGSFSDGGTALDQWAWNGEAWTSLGIEPSDGGPPFGGFECQGGAMTFLDRNGGELVAVGFAIPGGVVSPRVGYYFTWVGQWTGSSYAWSGVGAEMNPNFDWVLLAQDPALAELALLTCLHSSDGQSENCHLSRWDGVDPAGWTLAVNLPPIPVGEYLALSPVSDQDPDRPFLVAVQDLNDQLGNESWQCGLHGAGCVPSHHTGVAPELDFCTELAFDESGHALQGGAVPTLWDGQEWNALPPGPSLREEAAIGYQPVDGRFWLYSGEYDGGGGVAFGNDDLWALSLDGGWTQLSSNLHSTGRQEDVPVFVPDAGLDDALISLGSGGGPALDLVLLPDGGAEALHLATAPYGSPAYDPVRKRMVMACSANGTFAEADPPSFSTWHNVAQGLRDQCGAAWDPSSQQLLVVGGEAPGVVASSGEVDVWDGTTLTPLPLADPEADGNPATPYFSWVAADPKRQTLLLLQADPLVVNDPETWELSLATVRPQLACRFSFAAAQAAPGAVANRLVVEAEAASGTADRPQPTQLLLWRNEHWEPMQSCPADQCPPETLGTLHWETEDPDEVARCLRDLDTVGMAIAAYVDGGQDPIALRNPQVTISYQLP